MVGNPNSGKTTLFNQLTGNHQYVGQLAWRDGGAEDRPPQERQERPVRRPAGNLLRCPVFEREEVISRNYLIDGHPDVIVNIVIRLEPRAQPLPDHSAHRVDVTQSWSRSTEWTSSRSAAIPSNPKRLLQQLQVPVVENGRTKGDGLEDLVATTMKAAREGIVPQPVRFTPSSKPRWPRSRTSFQRQPRQHAASLLCHQAVRA